MINNKKIIFSIFSILFAISIFALTGCSDKKYAVGTPQNPYKIIWYTIGPTQKDLPMVEKKINKYLREKIGAVLDIRMIDWGEYDRKMNVILISGEKYDLCFTSSWANNYERNAMRGAFHPLNKLLKQYGKGILKTLNPAFLKGPKIDGELYAIPTNKEAAQQTVYLFNNKILKENGYSLSDFKPYAGVDTLKSMMPFFTSVKKNNPGIVPFAIDRGSDLRTKDLAFILGDPNIPGAVKIKKGNYKVINQFKSKEYLKFYKLIDEMYKKGYVPADAAVLPTTNTLIVSQKTAVNRESYQPCADQLWSLNYGYKMSSIPAFKPVISNSSVEGAMIAISLNAKRPDIDMKFLNLLNTDKYLRNLIQSGIEGIHYKKIGPNRIEYLPEHNNYLVPSFTLGNFFLTYLLPSDPANKWEQFKKWNDSATKSELLGFHFDPTPVTSELAAISNVCKQYTPGLMTGQMNYKTYLPKFEAALQNAGLKRFLAEEQSQLNEWAKKN
ncbi:MAG TPA: ABC transporter substrate-binding protein [Victivallales bacterium]|nr:ABC transporter substrate-binding protein [Victivallales bacterium]